MGVAGGEALGQALAEHDAGGLGRYHLGHRRPQGGPGWRRGHQHQPGLRAKLPDTRGHGPGQGEPELAAPGRGRARCYHHRVEAAQLGVKRYGAGAPAGQVEQRSAPGARTGEGAGLHPAVLDQRRPHVHAVDQLQGGRRPPALHQCGPHGSHRRLRSARVQRVGLGDDGAAGGQRRRRVRPGGPEGQREVRSAEHGHEPDAHARTAYFGPGATGLARSTARVYGHLEQRALLEDVGA